MKFRETKRSLWVSVLALVAIFFGLLTVVSGGVTLFNAQARQAAGNYVAFVLWFNFLAGFAYVIAGIGLWRLHRWSLWLSIAIAAVTLTIFGLFGLAIMNGVSYESRTVAAMSLRAVVWSIVSAVAYQHFKITHNELQM